MSNSVRPQRWQPTRLPHPWDSPGKNTGVGCHFLLQYMKVKSESEVAQSCPTLSNPMDCSLPGSSIHGICLARVLEWGAIAFSKRLWQTSLIVYLMYSLLSTLIYRIPLSPRTMTRPAINHIPGPLSGLKCPCGNSIEGYAQWSVQFPISFFFLMPSMWTKRLNLKIPSSNLEGGTSQVVRW